MHRAGEGVGHLGLRLRAARVARGLGVRELARVVDCSASLISQIERGRANPSVSRLYAMSTALGVSLDGLFQAAEDGGGAPTFALAPEGRFPPRPAPDLQPPVAVLRRADRRAIALARAVEWQLLMPAPERGAEFMEVIYAPGGGSTEGDHAASHQGREYSLILEGTLSARIGSLERTLEPGDSMAFESTVPHRFWNAGATPVRGIWFVSDRLPGPPVAGGAPPSPAPDRSG